jgi:hydroxymethylpyrimidine pyrophosphatase-like HAD family hydrolase
MSDSLPLLRESRRALDALGGIDLLYTDLDGTLLGRGGSALVDADGAPTLELVEAVLQVNLADLPVVVVSGRTSCMLKEITRMLSWRDYIAEMGTVVSRGGALAYELGEWPEGSVPAERTPYEVITGSGAVDALFDAFPGALEYHAPHHVGREVTHLFRGEVDLRTAQEVLAVFDPPVCLLDNGVIHPPKHTLEGCTEIRAYHLMPRGVSKTTAVQADLSARGLSPERAAMAGDAPADLEVAGAVGLLVLMGNALDSPDLVRSASLLSNVVATPGRSSLGWSELARAWIEARGDTA